MSQSKVTIILTGDEYRTLMFELQYLKDSKTKEAKAAPNNSDGHRMRQRAMELTRIIDKL